MAGPLVHLASMKQVQYLSKKHLNIPIDTSNKILVMEPDITGDHAGWNVVTNGGNLYKRLQAISKDIIEIAKVTEKDVNKINIPLFSRHVRYINHYIVDAHTLGHLASDTHKLEYRLEPAGEFVWRKKSLEVDLPSFTHFAEFRSSLIKSSRYIYDAYKKSAESWFFLLFPSFRKMIREAVKYGAEYTVALVKLSWDSV